MKAFIQFGPLGTNTVGKRNLSCDCEQKVLHVRDRDEQIDCCVFSTSQNLLTFSTYLSSCSLLLSTDL